MKKLEQNFKHWKELDRYENDPIFQRVVDEFEEYVSSPPPPKVSEEQKIIDFLTWYYKEAEENPMRFETDYDDIAKMYLSLTQERTRRQILY